jgi:hypothetical protein
MKRLLWILILVGTVLAQVQTATCPQCGQHASLEHTSGFGPNRTCTYGHNWRDPDNSYHVEHHEWTVACPDP